MWQYYMEKKKKKKAVLHPTLDSKHCLQSLHTNDTSTSALAAKKMCKVPFHGRDSAFDLYLLIFLDVPTTPHSEFPHFPLL